ncbi:MAG: Nif11-like leader peptide family RiPP precursor [Ruminococcus sp.]|nr:Nif11-like leader peptide family RiPP precursor [Ruminococcus sp.]
MSENLKKFMEAVSAEGQETIEKVNNADKETLIAIAAERGITLTDADFEQELPEGELSDDELDAVAGGDSCVCFIGGGGSSDETVLGTDEKCTCVFAGVGKGVDAKSPRERRRCICDFAGIGDSFA